MGAGEGNEKVTKMELFLDPLSRDFNRLCWDSNALTFIRFTVRALKNWM